MRILADLIIISIWYFTIYSLSRRVTLLFWLSWNGPFQLCETSRYKRKIPKRILNYDYYKIINERGLFFSACRSVLLISSFKHSETAVNCLASHNISQTNLCLEHMTFSLCFTQTNFKVLSKLIFRNISGWNTCYNLLRLLLKCNLSKF